MTTHMFDTLCALPLTSELFTQALHPSEPLLAVGLAAGHVQAFRLPDNEAGSSASSPLTGEDEEKDDSSNAPSRRSSLSSLASAGRGLISTVWRTRRHKGSCRTLAFSQSGDHLFSSGTDGLVKVARSEDGRVEAKIAIPYTSGDTKLADSPCLIDPLTPTSLLLATDSGALHLYDTRILSSSAASTPSAADLFVSPTRPAQTWHPHGEYVTSLTPLPPSTSSTSGLPRQFLTTGGTTLSLIDVRKGLVATSSEGREILTSSAVLASTGKHPFLLTGDSGGSVLIWDRAASSNWEFGAGRNKVDVKRFFDASEGEKVEVDGMPIGESIDCLCAMPETLVHDLSGNLQNVGVLGWDSGNVEIVSFAGTKGRRAKVEGRTLAHVAEGIAALDFDSSNRLVVGAGNIVKIYGIKGSEGEADSDQSDADAADDSDDEVDINLGDKRVAADESDTGNKAEGSDGSEGEVKKPGRKKRKKQKGKSNGPRTFSFTGLD